MARKAEFTVKPAGKGYALTTGDRQVGLGGNLSELYRQADETWISFAKALGVYGKHSKITFLATHPTPYAKGSLQPLKTAIVTSKSKTLKTKPIREKAVQKIVDDARRVGSGKIPKTAPGRAYIATAKKGEDLRNPATLASKVSKSEQKRQRARAIA